MTDIQNTQETPTYGLSFQQQKEIYDNLVQRWGDIIEAPRPVVRVENGRTSPFTGKQTALIESYKAAKNSGDPAIAESIATISNLSSTYFQTNPVESAAYNEAYEQMGNADPELIEQYKLNKELLGYQAMMKNMPHMTTEFMLDPVVRNNADPNSLAYMAMARNANEARHGENGLWDTWSRNGELYSANREVLLDLNEGRINSDQAKSELEKNSLLYGRPSDKDHEVLGSTSQVVQGMVDVAADHPVELLVAGAMSLASRTLTPLTTTYGALSGYDTYQQTSSQMVLDLHEKFPDVPEEELRKQVAMYAGAAGLIDAVSFGVVGRIATAPLQRLMSGAISKGAAATVTEGAASQAASTAGKGMIAGIAEKSNRAIKAAQSALIGTAPRRLAMGFVAQGTAETVTEGVQDAIAKYGTNVVGNQYAAPDQQVEPTEGVWDTALESMKMAAGPSFILGGVTTGINANVMLIEKAVNVGRMERASRMAAVAATIGNDMNLAKTNPVVGAYVINRASAQAGNQIVPENQMINVNAEALRNECAELGIDPSQLSERFANLDEAIEKGEDVQITFGEFCTMPTEPQAQLGGKTVVEFLANKVSFDGMTGPEAVQSVSDMDRAEVQAAIGEQQEMDRARFENTDYIRNTVMQGFSQAGIGRVREVEGIADMTANFFQAMAEITGVNAKELFEKAKLKINAVDYGGDLDGTGKIETDKNTKGWYGVNPKTGKTEVNFRPDADFATQLHEMSHFMLAVADDIRNSLSKRGEHNAILDTLFDNLTAWATPLTGGKKYGSLAELREADFNAYKKVHEAFVRDLQAYLFVGKPDPKVRGLFNHFKNWLRSVRNTTLFRQGREKLSNEQMAARVTQSFGQYDPNGTPGVNDSFAAVMDTLFKNKLLMDDLYVSYPSLSAVARFDKSLFPPEKLEEINAKIQEIEKQQAEAYVEGLDSLDQLTLRENIKLLLRLDDAYLDALKKRIEADGDKDERAAAFKELLGKIPELRKTIKQQLPAEAERIRNTEQGKEDLAFQTSQIVLTDEMLASLPEDVQTLIKRHNRALKDGPIIDPGVWLEENSTHNTELGEVIRNARQQEGGNPLAAALEYALSRRSIEQQALDNLTDKIQKILVNAKDSAIPDMQSLEMSAMAVKTRMAMGKNELAVLDKLLKEENKVSLAKIKAVANEDVRRQKMNVASPHAYLKMAAKARERARKAAAMGNISECAKQLRTEYYNLARAQAVEKIRHEVQTKLDRASKFIRRNKDSLARSYDTRVLELYKKILVQVGVLGQKHHPDEKQLAADMADLSDQLALQEIYRESMGADQGSSKFIQFYGNMQVSDLLKLLESLDNVKQIARNLRKATVENRNLNNTQQAEQLINSWGINKRKDQRPDLRTEGGLATTQTSGQETKRGITSVFSNQFRQINRRVETLCQELDGGDMGFWHKYVWQPIQDAYDTFLEKHNELLTWQKKVLAGIAPMLGHGPVQTKLIRKEFDTRQYGDDVRNYYWVLGAKNTRLSSGQELLGMLLHYGNESNFEKFCDGYLSDEAYHHNIEEKKAAVEAFIREQMKSGRITKEVMDVVQAIWSKYDEIGKDVNKAAFEVSGVRFKVIPKRTVVTPWGNYEGGYVPVFANTDIATNARTEKDIQVLRDSVFNENPHAPDGMLKDRTQAKYQVSVDPVEILNRMRKHQQYAYMQPAVSKVQHLLRQPALKQVLDNVMPEYYKNVFLPWLTRSALLQTSVPFESVPPQVTALARFFNRAISGILLCCNISNTLQQVSQFSAALTKCDATLLMKHATEIHLWWQKKDQCLAESRAMRNRYHTRYDESGTIFKKLEVQASGVNGAVNKTKARAQLANQAMRENTFIMQKVLQNGMDIIVYSAAKETYLKHHPEATEKDAITYAEMAVRTTQTSMNPVDMASMEVTNPVFKMFTMFISYFNSMVNLQRAEFAKVCAKNGSVLEKAVGWARVQALTLALPGIIASMIARVMAGDDAWDTGDDDEYDLSQQLMGNIVAPYASMIFSNHWLGSVGVNALNRWQGKYYYNDSLLNVPIYTEFQKAARLGEHLYDTATGDDDSGLTYKDIRAGFEILGILLAPPVAALGRPASMAYGEMTGQLDLEAQDSLWQAMRALLTGTANDPQKGK